MHPNKFDDNDPGQFRMYRELSEKERRHLGDIIKKKETELKSSRAKYDLYRAYAEDKVKNQAKRIKEAALEITALKAELDVTMSQLTEQATEIERLKEWIEHYGLTEKVNKGGSP